MVHHTRQVRPGALLVAAAVMAAVTAVLAQQEPVATMFRADLKRGDALALSFLPIELPAAGSAPPLHVYLSAGDLERAFDAPSFRPDAAIMPTNTGLVITAASPTSQRVLVGRVSKHPQVMAELQDQIPGAGNKHPRRVARACCR